MRWCRRIGNVWVVAIVIGFAGAANVGQAKTRVDDSPVGWYDLTACLKFDPADAAQVADVWEHVHAVATLQGIVNRDGPRLYVRFVRAHGRNLDDHWYGLFSRPGEWLHKRPIERIGSLEELIKRHRKRIKGAVVYDPAVHATSNLASTIAGADDLIAVRYNPRPGSVYDRLINHGPKLPVKVRLLNKGNTSMFTGKGTIPGTDRTSTGSAKCDAYLWIKHHYLDAGKLNPAYIGYYTDSYWTQDPASRRSYGHMLVNHDFWVSKRALFIDLFVWDDEAPVDDPGQKPGTDLDTFKTLLRATWQRNGPDKMIHVGGFPQWEFKYSSHGNAGSKHDPVPTEWMYAQLVSAYNAFIDADAGHLAVMANASFWQHFPGDTQYPQKWVTTEELQRRGYVNADGSLNIEGRDLVVFYVGDYDSAGWVYQLMPSLYDHPDRGMLPLMWAINPNLDRRVPHILHYVRKVATSNDYFVAGDNGAGYVNAGMLQEPRPISGLPSGLDAWREHCLPYYEKWGLTITGFLIDGFSPGPDARCLDAYAAFSPNGIVPQKVPPSLLHGDMPVLRADADLPDDPEKAGKLVAERTEVRALPFHWFRAVIKSPDWFVKVRDGARRINPAIEVVDPPTFFELYRRYLQRHPAAAAGRLPLLHSDPPLPAER